MAKRRVARQARAQVTMDAILTAAAQVIAAHGYGRASTNRIAERAGVSVGSLYQYFNNKDEICAALIAREGEALVSGLQAVKVGAHAKPVEAFNAYIRIGAGDGNLLFQFFSELRRVPQFQPRLDAITARAEAEIEGLITLFRPDLAKARTGAMASVIIRCAEGIGFENDKRAAQPVIEEFQTMVARYVLGEPE